MKTLFISTPSRDKPFALTGLAADLMDVELIDLIGLTAVVAFVAGVGTFLVGIG